MSGGVEVLLLQLAACMKPWWTPETESLASCHSSKHPFLILELQPAARPTIQSMIFATWIVASDVGLRQTVGEAQLKCPRTSELLMTREPATR